MNRYKTKQYILIYVLIVLLFLNINSNVFSQQRQLPICVAPTALLSWPDMTTNTIPIASSSGILKNSFIKYNVINATSVYYSIFNTLNIHSQLDNLGNIVNDPRFNRGNWVTINLGPLYTTGPRNNFNSGGAIGFWDISTSSNKLYNTIFSIDQIPYIAYDNSGSTTVLSNYGYLRFNYGEFNPTNATITGRLGQIPPRKAIWRGSLLTLNWNGNVGMGTITPAEKLHVIGNVIVSGTTTASSFCLGNNCITSWPSVGVSNWRLSGNNLYATPTNVNVGIGTTNPENRIHISGGGIILEGGLNILAIRRPSTEGGYARGLWFYKPTGTHTNGNNIEAGIGFRGAGNNPPDRIYLTHGPNGWDSTNGIHILRNGNVGIGTIDPQVKLDVRGVVGTNAVFGFSNVQQTNSPYGVYISAPASQSMGLFTNYIERIRINSNGNVGIGTNNPQYRLHVVGTTTVSALCLGNDCRSSWPISGINNWTLSGNNLYATPTNVNVGIGTNNPQYRLHVENGNILINSQNNPNLTINKTNDNTGAYLQFNSQNLMKWKLGLAQGAGNYFVLSGSNNEPVVLIDNMRRLHIGTESRGDAKLNVYGSQKIYSSDGSRLILEITEE